MEKSVYRPELWLARQHDHLNEVWHQVSSLIWLIQMVSFYYSPFTGWPNIEGEFTACCMTAWAALATDKKLRMMREKIERKRNDKKSWRWRGETWKKTKKKENGKESQQDSWPDCTMWLTGDHMVDGKTHVFPALKFEMTDQRVDFSVDRMNIIGFMSMA